MTKATQEIENVQRSMNQCDAEQSKVELQCQNLQSQVNTLDQNLTVVMRERQKLEETRQPVKNEAAGGDSLFD